MPDIHPSSVIDSGAQVGEDVSVGPFCYVGPKVKLGRRSRLVSHVSILGDATIGQDNTVWPHATVGAKPQDLKFHGERTQLIIGDHNDIRESVTIHAGTDNGGGVTRIGNDNLIMVGAHVAHDCVLGNHIVITNAVQLAGHIQIGDHAVIGGASAVHSYVSIGQFAFIGGMTRVTKDVPPFMTVEGNPAVVRGVNSIGLERNRFTTDQVNSLKEACRRLYRNANGDVRNMAENLTALEAEFEQNECIQTLVQSIQRSMIGLHGRYREAQRHDNRRTNPAR